MIATDKEPYITFYCQECGINSITLDAREPQIWPANDYWICPDCLHKRSHWEPDIQNSNSDDDDDGWYYDEY